MTDGRLYAPRLRKVLRGRIQRQGRMDGTIWLWKVLRGLILDTVDIFGEPKSSGRWPRMLGSKGVGGIPDPATRS